jgi:hypothetical protein
MQDGPIVLVALFAIAKWMVTAWKPESHQRLRRARSVSIATP